MQGEAEPRVTNSRGAKASPEAIPETEVEAEVEADTHHPPTATFGLIDEVEAIWGSKQSVKLVWDKNVFSVVLWFLCLCLSILASQVVHIR